MSIGRGSNGLVDIEGRRRITGRLAVPAAEGGLLLVFGLVMVLIYSEQYFAGVFVLAFPFAVVTVGMVVQIGFSRQIVFSQSVFMGVGAYGVALLNTKAHIASAPATVIVTAAGGVLAYVVGRVVCRARGLALPVATLMFSFIASGFVGGANALGGVIGTPSMGNLWPWGSPNAISLGDDVIVVIVLASVMFVGARLMGSQVGLELFMLGASETTAAAAGVDTARRRVELFVTGSTLATLGGAMYAGSQTFVPWSLITSGAQFFLLLMLFLGGRRSVLGAVVGTVIIQYLAGISLYIALHILLIEGALVTLILLIEPDGLAGIALAGWRLAMRIANRSVMPSAAATRYVDGIASSDGAVRSTTALEAEAASAWDPPLPASVHARGRVETAGRAPSAGEDLLVVEDVVKRFGGLEVLDHVALSLPSSGIFGLCGPNGAGKSILLNTIGGNLPPTSGRILLGGEEVTFLDAHEHFERGVARTFQTVHLVPGRSVVDNVAVATLSSKRTSVIRSMFDTGMPEALARAEAALELLGIEELRDRDVASLTLEGQRMVELARAMASQPRLLLLDEPASGLSTPQREAFKATLRSVSASTTVLLVEHDLHLVADVAEKIFVLVSGRLVFEGDSTEFFASDLVRSVLIGGSARQGLRRRRAFPRQPR